MFRINHIITRCADANPWTNVYGVARSLLAIGTLITFVFNDTGILFRPAVGMAAYPICQGIAGNLSLFCVLQDHLEIARYLTIGILLLVVIGWRPMLTGILHWWVSFSYISSSILVDGGDHITAVLSLLLLPITLVDKREWHWQTEQTNASTSQRIRNILANTTTCIIRIQVAIVYLHAAAAKCAVDEWVNGTALYYWFTDPVFGLNDTIYPLFYPLLTNAFSVTILTWGVIVFEFALFLGLVVPRHHRSTLLVLGVCFHLMIVLVHGLASFYFAMSGALVLYLRPLDWPIPGVSIKEYLRRKWTYLTLSFSVFTHGRYKKTRSDRNH